MKTVYCYTWKYVVCNYLKSSFNAEKYREFKWLARINIVTGNLLFLGSVPYERVAPDNSGIGFHVTSRLKVATSQKRKWAEAMEKIIGEREKHSSCLARDAGGKQGHPKQLSRHAQKTEGLQVVRTWEVEKYFISKVLGSPTFLTSALKRKSRGNAHAYFQASRSGEWQIIAFTLFW